MGIRASWPSVRFRFTGVGLGVTLRMRCLNHSTKLFCPLASRSLTSEGLSQEVCSYKVCSSTPTGELLGSPQAVHVHHGLIEAGKVVHRSDPA